MLMNIASTDSHCALENHTVNSCTCCPTSMLASVQTQSHELMEVATISTFTFPIFAIQNLMSSLIDVLAPNRKHLNIVERLTNYSATSISDQCLSENMIWQCPLNSGFTCRGENIK